MNITLYLMLCFCFCRNVRSTCNVQLKFLIQFTEFLSRSNCILLDDPEYGYKYFTRHFISSTYITPENVFPFLLFQEAGPPQRTVLVAKGHDLSTYEGILQQLPDPRLISRFTWIVILNSTFHPSKYQNRIFIPYDSEFFLIEPSGEKSYDIWEIYMERNSPKMHSNLYGSWSFHGGLIASRLSFFIRRRNLESYPMTVITQQKNCHTSIECSLREIWSDLATYLNISTNYLTIEEGERKISEMREDISWDVHLEPMTFDTYTFTTKAIAPIWKINVYMYVRHELNQNFSWRKYFSDTWNSSIFYILIWLVLLSLSFTLFDYIQSLYFRKRKFHPTNGFFAVFFWTCNQGGIYAEPRYSLIFILIRISAVVIQIFVSGSLVSLLPLSIPDYPFDGLTQLVQTGSYKLIILNGSLSQIYLQLSPLAEESQLLEMFLPRDEMPATLTQQLEMICGNGKIVAFADDYDLMVLQDETMCQILRIPQPVATIFCGIPLYEESPFEFIFNSAFNKFIESGIIMKIRRKVHQEWREEKDNSLHPITFNQVRPLFLIIECGMAVSLLAWIAEVLYFFGKDHENSRENQNFHTRNNALGGLNIKKNRKMFFPKG